MSTENILAARRKRPHHAQEIVQSVDSSSKEDTISTAVEDVQPVVETSHKKSKKKHVSLEEESTETSSVVLTDELSEQPTPTLED